MRFALTLAALMAAATPALALGENDAWQRYQQNLQPLQQWQPTWISPAQPTWSAPPAQYLTPPPRLQTTCYTIGNIITCY